MMNKILWNASIFLIGLFAVGPAMAADLTCSVDSSLGLQELNSKIKICQQEADREGYSFLSRLIGFGDELCIVSEVSAPDIAKNCKQKLIQTSLEIFNCKNSKVRMQEMAASDEKEFAKTLKEHGEVPVPDSIQTVFARLIQAARKLMPSLAMQEWRLRAYGAKYFNAHAGADYSVLVSAGFWAEGSKFDMSEIAAILSHEIGHTLRDHSVQQGCLALEWSGDTKHTLPEALVIMREGGGWDGGERWETYIRKSKEAELEADAVATQLLKEAGYSPYLMVDALAKLRPKSEGMGSNSHPDFELRIQKAREAADQLIH
jgi:predicted Zn-dependent protease